MFRIYEILARGLLTLPSTGRKGAAHPATAAVAAATVLFPVHVEVSFASTHPAPSRHIAWLQHVVDGRDSPLLRDPVCRRCCLVCSSSSQPMGYITNPHTVRNPDCAFVGDTS